MAATQSDGGGSLRPDPSHEAQSAAPPAAGDAFPGFVDAHHHLWDLGLHRYAWLEEPGLPETTAWIGDYAPIRASYLVTDLIEDAIGCGLAGSVHAEALWSDDSVEETAWLQAVADEHGLPQAIVARVDLRRTDADAELARHATYPNFRGVRMAEMRGLISDPAFRRGFGKLARLGLSYDLNISSDDAASALDLARAFPDTQIAIDNMANPVRLGPEVLKGWRLQMRKLTDTPNITMKISGLGMADHRWTVNRIRPWVLEAIDIFGVDRCMFGSNWPVDRLYGTYRDLVAAYATICETLNRPEREALFAGTARRVYRI